MAHDGEFFNRLTRASDAVARVSAEGDSANTGDVFAAVSQIVAEWVPELLTTLERDRAAGAFTHWGLSTVNDENAGRPVIGRSLFEFVHRAAAVDCQWPLGNAGVLHAYGYLLSNVVTPFGLKRDRWIGGELSAGLGMPAEWFLAPLLDTSGTPGTPAFLTRVTECLREVLAEASGRVSSDGTSRHGAPGTGTSAATGSGSGSSSGSGSRSGSIIRAVVDEFAGEEREEIARAVFVESAANPNARAVVYAVLLGESTHLITAFPVTAGPAKWLSGLTATAPRLRYNAAAHELPPRSALSGRRIHTFE